MPHFHPIRSGNLWFWDPILPHLNSNRFGNSIFSDNRCIRFPWEQTLRFTFAQIRTWPIFSTTDLKIHLFCNADVPFFIHFFFPKLGWAGSTRFFWMSQNCLKLSIRKNYSKKKTFPIFLFLPFSSLFIFSLVEPAQPEIVWMGQNRKIRF